MHFHVPLIFILSSSLISKYRHLLISDEEILLYISRVYSAH
jgi:hypothetical protein